jgi:hypothetical protein
MTDGDETARTAADSQPVRDQLAQAVRDLWSMVLELGDDYVVFMDRRRLNARVGRAANRRYRVAWEEDGTWVEHTGDFENPREAAFHAYQGPHECR